MNDSVDSSNASVLTSTAKLLDSGHSEFCQDGATETALVTDGAANLSGSCDEFAWMRYDKNSSFATLIIASVLLLMVFFYLPFMYWIESWKFSNAEKDLAKLVVQFSFAASVGVIARWLTWAAADIPPSPAFRGPTFSLLSYISRCVADTTSTALIVTMVLLVAQSVTIDLGGSTVALQDADSALRMGLAFASGFFTRRTRLLLYNIGNLVLPKEIKDLRANEPRDE